MKIQKSDFDIKFLYDSPYEELKEQELIETRIGNFSEILGNENISWRYAAKKYLKWTHEDFFENDKAWKQDADTINIFSGEDDEHGGPGGSGGPGGPGGDSDYNPADDIGMNDLGPEDFGADEDMDIGLSEEVPDDVEIDI